MILAHIIYKIPALAALTVVLRAQLVNDGLVLLTTNMDGLTLLPLNLQLLSAILRLFVPRLQCKFVSVDDLHSLPLLQSNGNDQQNRGHS